MGVDPISAILIGTTVAGTGMKVAGSLSEGRSRAAAHAYQAKVAEFNAQMAEREGVIESHTMGLKTRAKLGGIKAKQAAAGVDVNTGTAVEVQAAQRQLGALDALTIRSNAARRAYGYRLNKGMSEAASADARRAGRLGTISSLIGGARSLAGDFRDMQGPSSLGSTPIRLGSEMSVDFDPGYSFGGGGGGPYETYELL